MTLGSGICSSVRRPTIIVPVASISSNNSPGPAGRVPGSAPLVQPVETVAAGVAQLVVRTRDVSVE
jgi:hypothetical protein